MAYRKQKKTQAAQAAAQVAKNAAKAPAVVEELTPYGTKAYRTTTTLNRFTGLTGTAQEALVLDIDGTMQGWGGGLNKELHDWCEKHYKRNPDIVFLVITARDHEYMYETSFNWCMRDFPYAFIGPFCRAVDDPRLASEFKRQLAQGFEDMGLYRIVGAADDNQYVNMMWKHWKATRNAEFDLLECDPYAGYGTWRSGLSSKGHSASSWSSSAWSSGKFVNGKWVDTTAPVVPTVAKNRPAGTREFTDTPVYASGQDLTKSAAWGHYLAQRYGNVVSESPAGHVVVSYTSLVPDEAQVVEAVIEEIEDVLPPPILTRTELEDQAHHANPHWTPEYIAKLPEVDLREAAGITNGDYREMLYAQIGYVFGSRCCDGELDWLDLDQIEPMLDMTREEIEAELDRYAEEDHQSGVVDLDAEERTRREQRMDLEDLALKVDPSLTLEKVQAMDSVDLHNRVAELLATGEVVA